MSGRIPPKHKLQDILQLALDYHNSVSKSELSQSRGCNQHSNPFKEVLEQHSINFPDNSATETLTEMQKHSGILKSRPTSKEEEEQPRIALSLSSAKTVDSSQAKSNLSSPNTTGSFVPSIPYPYYYYPQAFNGNFPMQPLFQSQVPTHTSIVSSAPNSKDPEPNENETTNDEEVAGLLLSIFKTSISSRSPSSNFLLKSPPRDKGISS